MALYKHDFNVPNPFCSITGGMKTINIDKTITFKKALFSRSHKTLTLTDNGYLTIAYTIPENIEVHVLNLQCWVVGGPFLFQHLPYCSFTNGGTGLIPRNHYAVPGTIASVLTLYTAPTDIVPIADSEMEFYFGGSSGIAHTGGAGIFSPDGEYIFGAGSHITRIQNLSGEVAPAQISVTWYEMYI